ncbi:MAG: hypothetical protein QOK48_3430, partial [Blastocatellia bacterium]|nr:hypothetical protein [Blastocatellia bacterium]
LLHQPLIGIAYLEKEMPLSQGEWG